VPAIKENMKITEQQKKEGVETIGFNEVRILLNSRKGRKKFESNLKAAKKFTDELQQHRYVDPTTMQDIIDL
jgi:hypothetical protein